MDYAGFSVDDARRIAQAVIESETYVDSTSRSPHVATRAGAASPLVIEIGKAAGTIPPSTEFPPASPGELNSVEFAIWKPDDSDNDREAATQDSVTAYDWLGTGIAGGETAHLVRVFSVGVGKWYFIKKGGGAGFVFTVDTAFTTIEQIASVTVTNAWGGAPTGLQNVVNLPNSKGDFVFAGEVGAYGYALEAEDGNFRIFQMECHEAPTEGDWNDPTQ